MKKLVITLLLMSGCVHAAEYWTSRTEAGGRIVLTFDRADYCGKVLYVAYVEKPTQEVVYGCWTILYDKIHVKYSDDNRMVYDMDGWVKMGKP